MMSADDNDKNRNKIETARRNSPYVPQASSDCERLIGLILQQMQSCRQLANDLTAAE